MSWPLTHVVENNWAKIWVKMKIWQNLVKMFAKSSVSMGMYNATWVRKIGWDNVHPTVGSVTHNKSMPRYDSVLIISLRIGHSRLTHSLTLWCKIFCRLLFEGAFPQYQQWDLLILSKKLIFIINYCKVVIFWEGACAKPPPYTPNQWVRGHTSHALPPSAPSAPLFSHLQRSTSVPSAPWFL